MGELLSRRLPPKRRTLGPLRNRLLLRSVRDTEDLGQSLTSSDPLGAITGQKR